MPRRKIITAEKEEEIIAALEVDAHASRVARKVGVSFSTVWRRAEQAGIELTAGREAKGYKRLSLERRAAVVEARRAMSDATQKEVARRAGVSRSTVSRLTGGDSRRGGVSPGG